MVEDHHRQLVIWSSDEDAHSFVWTYVPVCKCWYEGAHVHIWVRCQPWVSLLGAVHLAFETRSLIILRT